MLGEHSWWGKNVGPTYNEIANIPLFIWDPRHKLAGETRNALVQTIDLAPTIYNYFQVQVPESVMGKDLENVIVNDIPVRCAAVYGSHGGNINCTDGRYVYMRAPDPDNDNLSVSYTHLDVYKRQRRTGGYGNNDYHLAVGLLRRLYFIINGIYGPGNACRPHFKLQICSGRGAGDRGGKLWTCHCRPLYRLNGRAAFD